MIYETLVNLVLQLADEYSKKGTVNPVAKTADLRIKMPGAANEIQQDLANDKGRLHKDLVIINAAATYPTETTVALPSDWLKVAKVMQRVNDSYWIPFVDYRITDTSFIYCSKYNGQIVAGYYRKPTAIVVVNTAAPTAAELAQIIDVVPEAEYFVPAGVAGKILMVDNPSASAELLNFYEARKYMLNPGRQNYGVETIYDAYGGL